MVQGFKLAKGLRNQHIQGLNVINCLASKLSCLAQQGLSLAQLSPSLFYKFFLLIWIRFGLILLYTKFPPSTLSGTGQTDKKFNRQTSADKLQQH